MAAPLRLVLSALIPALVPALLAAQGATRPENARDLERLARLEGITLLPPADSVTAGPRMVAAGETVRGSIVARGPVMVAGRVEGSVVSLAGDVTVAAGGVVTGDALAVGGRVMAERGIVNGDMRSMESLPTVVGTAAVPEVRTPGQRVADAVRLVAATFGVVLVIAVAVLLFAAPNLDEVVATLGNRFARSFWTGLLGQLVILPGLVVLIVALAVSVIGILLIPFAIVAYAVAIAGLVTLGFLAVARLVGGALRPAHTATPRGRALTGLAVGIGLFFALWILAALFVFSPLVATVLRAAALAATWAAVTLGLGATILSRAGTHRKVPSGTKPIELASWQTPTPLTGVAARRTAVGELR